MIHMQKVAAITLEKVTKHYGSGQGVVAALTDVDLTIEDGEFVSIMGPSGSGKSTLLSLIAGLDTPTRGRVLVVGNDLSRLSDEARSSIRLRSIGSVFQAFNLLPTFTVLENVAWPLEFLRMTRPNARRQAGEALELVGIPPAAHNRRPAELSGGEQQRVAIARALATKPRLLLADEPTGNLDSRTGQAILDLLRGFNTTREVTVILVTHSTFAAAYGHRTIELVDGQIVHEVRADRERGGRVVPLRE
jgi:putative ABC transport system ATP-binding protein